MLFKAVLACEQAVFSRHILASANHRDFLMELALQVIYISLVEPRTGLPKLRVQVLLESTFTFDFGSVRNHGRNFP